MNVQARGAAASSWCEEWEEVQGIPLTEASFLTLFGYSHICGVGSIGTWTREQKAYLMNKVPYTMLLPCPVKALAADLPMPNGMDIAKLWGPGSFRARHRRQLQ